MSKTADRLQGVLDNTTLCDNAQNAMRDAISEIKFLHEHIRRTDEAQRLYHNCEQWHDETHEGINLREWVDAPFLAIKSIGIKS